MCYKVLKVTVTDERLGGLAEETKVLRKYTLSPAQLWCRSRPIKGRWESISCDSDASIWSSWIYCVLVLFRALGSNLTQVTFFVRSMVITAH